MVEMVVARDGSRRSIVTVLGIFVRELCTAHLLDRACLFCFAFWKIFSMILKFCLLVEQDKHSTVVKQLFFLVFTGSEGS